MKNTVNLIVVVVAGVVCALGCGGLPSNAGDYNPTVKSGRLTFAKSVTALNIGRDPIYRNVTQAFYINGKEWSPDGDPKFADKINWCDTSPNPKVEILRCFGNSTENYATTYILRMKNDQPEMQKINEGLPTVWLNDDGRWMLFAKSFLNVETGEKIDIKVLPFAGQEEGSLLPSYVIGVAPDMKTIVELPDTSTQKEGADEFLTLWLIDTETGKTEKRKVNFPKNPWLTDYKQPENDIQPPPAPSKKLVWEKGADGRDRLVVPQLLEKVER